MVLHIVAKNRVKLTVCMCMKVLVSGLRTSLARRRGEPLPIKTKVAALQPARVAPRVNECISIRTNASLYS